jgi:hypothetical protein
MLDSRQIREMPRMAEQKQAGLRHCIFQFISDTDLHHPNA